MINQCFRYLIVGCPFCAMAQSLLDYPLDYLMEFGLETLELWTKTRSLIKGFGLSPVRMSQYFIIPGVYISIHTPPIYTPPNVLPLQWTGRLKVQMSISFLPRVCSRSNGVI